MKKLVLSMPYVILKSLKFSHTFPTLVLDKGSFLLNETDKYDLEEMLNLTYSFISNAIENKGDNLTWSDLIKTFKL